MTNEREPHAAPPDAGGHLGAHTAPGDLLSHTTQERDEPQPPLQQLPPSPAGGFQGVFVGMWIVVLVLFALGMALAFR